MAKEKRYETKKRPFTGVGTALITPFRDGEIDTRAHAFNVARQIEGGVSFLVPCGTTGESPTLEYDEHIAMIAATVSVAQGQIPIMAGTGSNSTKEAVHLTKGAKNVGADAVLVVSPYYNKPEPDGMLDYYRSVAAVGLPVFLYDIPGRTGLGVPTTIMLQLAKEGTIAGMKWASGNLQQAKEMFTFSPDDFILLSGDDANTLDLIKQGGHGVISVTSNVLPREMSSFVAMALSGNRLNSEAYHSKLLPLMDGLFKESNPQPVKTAMTILFPEIFTEEFRSPMMPMRVGNRAALEKLLVSYKNYC